MRLHVAQIYQCCQVGQLTCRPRQRQALLQWAYDSRALNTIILRYTTN